MGTAAVFSVALFTLELVIHAVVYLAGVVLALRFFSPYRRAATFTLFGVGLLALAWLGQAFGLPAVLRRTGLHSEMQRWVMLFSLGRSLARAAGAALLLAAVFVERTPQ